MPLNEFHRISSAHSAVASKRDLDGPNRLGASGGFAPDGKTPASLRLDKSFKFWHVAAIVKP
jgi:hypothetical protein